MINAVHTVISCLRLPPATEGFRRPLVRVPLKGTSRFAGVSRALVVQARGPSGPELLSVVFSKFTLKDQSQQNILRRKKAQYCHGRRKEVTEVTVCSDRPLRVVVFYVNNHIYSLLSETLMDARCLRRSDKGQQPGVTKLDL